MNHELWYVKPTESTVLRQAVEVIKPFAEEGLMLMQTEQSLAEMAAKMHLLVAKIDGQVIGTAAYTFCYPQGTIEFGGWAVLKDLQDKHIGHDLMGSLLFKHPKYPQRPRKLIAVTNPKSGSIMASLGATELNHHQVEEAVFDACLNCNCDKSVLQPGQKCVDKIYDLATVRSKTLEDKLGNPISTGLGQNGLWLL